jgi:ABC-2 type transport system ATP-binding protein
MITTHDLTKRFDAVTAVENLTLEVYEGELLGLLGPNGAGKTTTVRMLACLIAPTAGHAVVCGHRVGEDNQAIRSKIGMLTEAPGLYESLTATQNLAIYAKLYGVSDVSRQVEKYLKLLELWDRRTEPVGTFSKGMKQKLALARALVHEPQLLFLDEPTSGLDPQMARLVLDFIQSLRAEGRTIVLCTHDLDEAERLCDRVAVLRTRLVVLDDPETLRARLFKHHTRVELTCVNDRVLEAVRELEFIDGVQQVGNTLLVAMSQPGTHNPLLVRRLVEVGAEVCYITPQEHSLEDVYLKLMEEAPRP